MEQEVLTRQTDWIALVLIGIGALLLLARLRDASKVEILLKLPFYGSAKEWASGFNPVLSKKLEDFLIGLAALLTIALSALLISRSIGAKTLVALDWVNFLRYTLVISLFLLFKTLIGALTGAIFEVQEALISAQNQYFAFSSWLILPLLPFCLLLTFTFSGAQWLAWLGLAILILGLFYALYQSAKTIMRLPPNIGYNIFYLCALEIIPAIYLFRILQDI